MESCMSRNVKARIHSKSEAEDDVVILSENGANDVRVSYMGNICTAVYNVFVGCYYVDDVYGIVGPDKDERY